MRKIQIARIPFSTSIWLLPPLRLRYRQNRNFNVIIPDETFSSSSIIRISIRRTVTPAKVGLTSNRPFSINPAALKSGIVCQRLSKVSGSDNNHIMFSVQPKIFPISECKYFTLYPYPCCPKPPKLFKSWRIWEAVTFMRLLKSLEGNALYTASQ